MAGVAEVWVARPLNTTSASESLRSLPQACRSGALNLFDQRLHWKAPFELAMKTVEDGRCMWSGKSHTFSYPFLQFLVILPSALYIRVPPPSLLRKFVIEQDNGTLGLAVMGLSQSGPLCIQSWSTCISCGPSPSTTWPRSIILIKSLNYLVLFYHNTMEGRGLLSSIELTSSQGLGPSTHRLLQFVLWELLRREALLGLFNWLQFVSWRCYSEPEWFFKGHDNSVAWLRFVQSCLLSEPTVLMHRYINLSGRGHHRSVISTSFSWLLDSTSRFLARSVLQVSVFPSASFAVCPCLWPNHIDSSSRLSDLRGPWLPSFSTRKKPSCPLERLYFDRLRIPIACMRKKLRISGRRARAMEKKSKAESG